MKKVLLIDSGLGGANILARCLNEVPCCDYLLFCDNKNLPYGNKSKQDLLKITIDNLEKIRSFFDFDIVIFACNTLTATVIEECREIYRDTVFIGTEPAILPALRKFEEKDVCVLATKTTIENNLLCKKYKNIMYKSIDNLAAAIDENIDNLSVLKPYLENELAKIDKKAVVLGCTHYTSITPILKEILPTVEFFSSEDGVSRRLRSFVDEKEENFKVQVMTSKESDFRNKILWYLNEKSKE